MSIRQSALWTVFLIACAVTSMLMSLWPILTIAASLEAAIIGRQTLAVYRGQQVRVQSPNAARQGALTAAIEPLAPAVERLGDPAVLARLAAALPEEAMWKNDAGGARWNGLDPDLNAAMAPLRWRGLLNAEHAGAAHQIDATPAIWPWEVVDPTWQAALDAIDVAMAVSALQSEGLPVTTGMAEARRHVLEIATEQPAATTQIEPLGSVDRDDPRRT